MVSQELLPLPRCSLLIAHCSLLIVHWKTFLTKSAKTSNFTFLSKKHQKRDLTFSGLTFFHKLVEKKVWKSGKQCVIFAPALQERPRGLEKKSRAILDWQRPSKRGLKKRWKIILAEKNICFIFAVAFEKRQGAKRGIQSAIESERGG